ncbi:hypothetical protein RISK_003555 [Rhodopirellula islandica]|uniref:Transmembrane protein n=1 Tax=Rhodopirellula islandica TaxID=595434 RepID=A0A0J1BDC8_RHOIS|nr:hypothetical protein [Rhodopirellula islandica]KLU04501.1 hypothetical protein RISK_003555 [Rhodopirellula islandica]
MLVTSCPRCHESVRIPDRLLSGQVATSAQIQCPWCLSTLDQQEIESAMPPALIVVGDDLNTASEPLLDLETIESDDEEPAELAGFTSADTVPELDDTELDSVGVAAEPLSTDDFAADEVTDLETLDTDSFEPAQDEPEFSSQESPAADENMDEFIIPDDNATPELGVATDAAPMAIYTSDKSRRKKKSLIKTVGSPILGALLALPIGGGLLWYLDALPNLGFYPLDGTYSSSNPVRRSASVPSAPGGYVPPIMDESPEGRSLGEDLDNGGGEETTPPPPVELDTSQTDMVPATDPASEALAELNDAVNNAVLDTDDFAMPSDDAPVTEVAKPAVDSNGTAMELPDTAREDRTPEEPAEEEPLTGFPGLPPAVMKAASEELDLPSELDPADDIPDNGESQLAESVKEVGKVLIRLEGMDPQDPKYGQAVAFAYGMLSRLSTETSADQFDQLQPLVDRIKSNADLFRSFAKQVPAWVDTPKAERQTDGAFILGKFVAAEETDGYQVRLMGGKAYPVTFADDVEAQTITAVAFGNIDVSNEPASFEINWIQPAQ